MFMHFKARKPFRATSLMQPSTLVPQQALDLVKAPTVLLDVKGAKPKEALKRLRHSIATEGEDQEGWIKRARIATVLGSCPKSHASFKSGLPL